MSDPTYKNLKSYQQAEIICDFTFNFCRKYLDPKSRTNDQMDQAARSGKQNIVEGTAASRGSPKTEITLLNVARASFQELLEDYFDFLRQRNLAIWPKDDPRTKQIRDLAYKSYTTYTTYKSYINNPESAANAMTTLINQTNYLLDRQIKSVRKFHEDRGMLLESHYQKVERILAGQRQKEKETEAWLNQQMESSGYKQTENGGWIPKNQ